MVLIVVVDCIFNHYYLTSVFNLDILSLIYITFPCLLQKHIQRIKMLRLLTDVQSTAQL
jgi:hypothetical protein